jgi:hypothetical protein
MPRVSRVADNLSRFSCLRFFGLSLSLLSFRTTPMSSRLDLSLVRLGWIRCCTPYPWTSSTSPLLFCATSNSSSLTHWHLLLLPNFVSRCTCIHTIRRTARDTSKFAIHLRPCHNTNSEQHSNFNQVPSCSARPPTQADLTHRRSVLVGLVTTPSPRLWTPSTTLLRSPLSFCTLPICLHVFLLRACVCLASSKFNFPRISVSMSSSLVLLSATLTMFQNCLTSPLWLCGSLGLASLL